MAEFWLKRNPASHRQRHQYMADTMAKVHNNGKHFRTLAEIKLWRTKYFQQPVARVLFIWKKSALRNFKRWGRYISHSDKNVNEIAHTALAPRCMWTHIDCPPKRPK